MRTILRVIKLNPFIYEIVQAQYQDLVEWFSTINRALSPSDSFIQAILRTDNPKVNEEVTIEINSTAPLESYVYEIMGRGNLVQARTVQVGGKNSHTLTFQVTPAMAPSARIVVYYVRPDGEVVADALNFEVEGTFQNFVRITGIRKFNPIKVDVMLNFLKLKNESMVVLLGGFHRESSGHHQLIQLFFLKSNVYLTIWCRWKFEWRPIRWNRAKLSIFR